MAQLTNLFIYLIIILVGVVCSYLLFKADRKGAFRFVSWFACTLVISFIVLDLVSNPFTLSLIVACVIAFMAVKDDK